MHVRRYSREKQRRPLLGPVWRPNRAAKDAAARASPALPTVPGMRSANIQVKGLVRAGRARKSLNDRNRRVPRIHSLNIVLLSGRTCVRDTVPFTGVRNHSGTTQTRARLLFCSRVAEGNGLASFSVTSMDSLNFLDQRETWCIVCLVVALGSPSDSLARCSILLRTRDPTEVTALRRNRCVQVARISWQT